MWSPLAAFIFDRWYVFGAFCLVAVLVITTVVTQGFRDLDAMAAPPEDDSPYREMEARDFLGKRFVADFVQQHPDEIDSDDWDADDSARTPEPVFSVETCPDLGSVPNSLLTTYRGQGDGLTVLSRVYGAGQARDHFERVRNVLEDCEDVSDLETFTTSTDPELAAFSFESGGDEYAVFTAGDVINEVSVGSDDAPVSLSEAVDYYAEYSVESLQREEWVCYDLTPSADDAQRSFFYDYANYEGLYDSEELTNETDISNLPSPALVRDGNDGATSVIRQPENPDSEVPESPLPDDMDEETPREPSRPVIPSEFETQEEFSETAVFEVSDWDGPGCGWSWSAQISPIYDEEAIEHNRNVIMTETQNDVERQAGSYLNRNHDYTLSVLRQDIVITNWNEWVDNVNSIHDSWQWLEEQRDILWEAWETYLANHEEWSSFPDRQDAAQEEYDEAIEQCLNQREEVQEWDDRYREAVESGEAVIEPASFGSSNSSGLVPGRITAVPASNEADDDDDDSDDSDSSGNATNDDEDDDGGSSNGGGTNEEEDDDDDEEQDSRSDEEDEEEEEEPLPTVPPRPTDCDTDNINEPSILSEDRGDEPTAPTVPEGVTVPESWENPNPSGD